MSTQVQQVRDLRLIQESPDKIVNNVVKGPRNVTYDVLAAQSGASNQGCTFQLPNTAVGCGRDRSHLYIQMSGSITITGTGFEIPAKGSIGFKPFPLNRNFSIVQHKIGNAIEVINTQQIIDVLSNLNMLPADYNYYANTQPDLFADYVGVYGSSLNPLNQYKDNFSGSGTLKSRSLGITSIVPSPTSIVVNFSLTEPLITPFSFMTQKDEPCIWNIPSENITITSAVQMNDMIAFNINQLGDGATVSGVSTTIISSSVNLLTCYVTTDPSEVSESSIVEFPTYYVQPNPLQKGIPNRSDENADAEKQLVNVTLNYQGIPDKLIWVARQTSTSRSLTNTSSLPDRFCLLTSPQIKLNNQPSNLLNADPRQMFDMSKRNGYAHNFEHWSAQVLDNGQGKIVGAGSVFICDPALDLAIAYNGLSNDFNVAYNLSAQFNAVNNLVVNVGVPSITSLECVCIAVSKKQLVRNGVDYISRPYFIEPEDGRQVLKLDSYVPLPQLEDNDRMTGAGFGNFFNKVKQGVKWGLENKDKIGEYYNAGKSMLGNFRNPVGGYEMGGYEMGGALKKKKGSRKLVKLHGYK